MPAKFNRAAIGAMVSASIKGRERQPPRVTNIAHFCWTGA